MSQTENLTTSTGLTAAQITEYEAKLLSYFVYNITLSKFGQGADTGDFGEAQGGTKNWARYHPISAVTAGISEGKTGDYDWGELKMQEIEASLEEWGKPIRFPMKHYHTSRDRTLNGVTKLLGENAAASIERYVFKTVIETGITGIHCGAISASNGTVDPIKYVRDVHLVAGTTTVLHLSDSDLGTFHRKAISGSMVGAWITVTNGLGYAHCARVTAYQSTGTAATISPALPETPQAYSATDLDRNTRVHICHPFNAGKLVASGDKVTTKVLQKAHELLRHANVPKFEDGRYALIVPTQVHTQLLNDSDWSNTAENTTQDATDGGLRSGSVKVWSGFTVYETNMTPRYAAAAGFQSFSISGGNVFVSLCLGMDAFGTPLLEGADGNVTGDMIEPSISFDIPRANDGNTSNPMKTFGTASWHLFWDVKSLNANNAVALFSYVT